MHTGSAPESPGITPPAIHMGVHIHPVPSLMCTQGMFQPDTTLHEQTHIPLAIWPWVGPLIIAVNSKGHLEFSFADASSFSGWPGAGQPRKMQHCVLCPPCSFYHLHRGPAGHMLVSAELGGCSCPLRLPAGARETPQMLRKLCPWWGDGAPP